MYAPVVTNVTGFWLKKFLASPDIAGTFCPMLDLPFCFGLFFSPPLPEFGPRQNQYKNYMRISYTCTNSSRFMSGKGDFNLSACSNSNMTLRVK